MKLAVYLNYKLSYKSPNKIIDIMTQLKDWGLHIICGNRNYDFLYSSLNNKLNYKITNLEIDKWNNDILLQTVFFWDKLDSENIFIFDDDTTLNNIDLNSLVGKYPYYKNIKLRQKNAMITCIKNARKNNLIKFYKNNSNFSEKYLQKEETFFYYALDLLGFNLPENNISNHTEINKSNVSKTQVSKSIIKQEQQSIQIKTNPNLINIIFMDFIGWDYNIKTPDKYPLGGTQSAVCYFIRELAKLPRYQIFLMNNISQPKDIDGVIHLPTCKNDTEFKNIFGGKIKFNKIIFISSIRNINPFVKLIGNNTPIWVWFHHDIHQPASLVFRNADNYKYVEKFIMVSEWQKMRFIKEYNVPHEKIIVMKNAISPHFENMWENSTIINKKKLILAYTSTPDRGLADLIEIFKVLKQKYGKQLRLWVFSSFKVYQKGEDSIEEQKYMELYNICKTTEGIEYFGSISQEELAKKMREVLIFTYPLNTTETFCIALSEALSAGCLAISTDIGGLNEASAKFANLIKYNSKQQYLQEFLNQVDNLITKALTDNIDLEKHLQKQVKYINNEMRWELRAYEFHSMNKVNVFQNACTDIEKHEQEFNKIINLRFPFRAESYNNLAVLYRNRDDFEKASELIENAIRLHPTNIFYITTLIDIYSININKLCAGTQYYEDKITEIDFLKKVTKFIHYCKLYIYYCNNDNIEINKEIIYKFLIVCWQCAITNEMEMVLDMICDKFPKYAPFWIYRAVLIPYIFDGNDSMNERLDLVKTRCLELLDNTQLSSSDEIPHSILFMNILLHYHNRNEREIMELLCKIYRKYFPKLKFTADLKRTSRKSRKLKIGFISCYFWKQSAGKLIRGIMHKLNKQKYDIYAYSLELKTDHYTEDIQDICYKYVSLPISSVEEGQQLIAKDKLDIVIFTDIGCNAYIYAIAHGRYAPIQAVHAWGHPTTSGLDTIDYALTMRDTEDKQEHYTEKMVEFNSLTPYYFKPTFEDPSALKIYAEKRDMNLKELFDREPLNREMLSDGKLVGKNVYMNIQSFFKFNPDWIIAMGKILLKDPNGVLILMLDNAKFVLKNKIIEIFINIFGKDIQNQIMFIKKISHNRFLDFLKLADVHLDSHPWGAGISMLEILAMGKVIISYPSYFLSGRFTYTCMKRIGLLNECVANNWDEYINKCVEVATNEQYRNKLEKHIVNSHDKIFDLQETVTEWENFLDTTT